MSNEQLIKGLLHDAGDYGREKLGLDEPCEMLSWGENNKRAWEASVLLEAAEAQSHHDIAALAHVVVERDRALALIEQVREGVVGDATAYDIHKLLLKATK